MLVSVILPCTRFDEYLIESVASILHQTYKNLELILVSSDNSAEFEEAIQNTFTDDRIFIHCIEISGLSNALNFGILKAKGEIIIRMDADDISMENRIEIIIETFKNNPKASLVFSDYSFIDESGMCIAHTHKLYYKILQTRTLLPFRCVIAHPTVAIPRKIILNYSGYLFGQYCEDYDLWLRMRRNRNTTFFHIRIPLLKYRVHGNQATSVTNKRKIFSHDLSLKVREFLYTGELIYIFAIIFTVLDCLYFYMRYFTRNISLSK